MRWQLDRRYVFDVIQATGNQRLIGVALKEADQHLHADARNGDGAVTISSPARRHTQPAAGVLVALRFAVPVELDLDPAMLVAVNLFTSGAGHHRALAAGDARFGMLQWRPPERLPRGGHKAVAIALNKSVDGACVTADRLFQRLRLLALVMHFREQPEIVPVVA